MENLTGTWEGEYSINIGTDEDTKVECHAFRLKLIDKNGELSGTTPPGASVRLYPHCRDLDVVHSYPQIPNLNY